ncbi:MAG: right-handed parallel beta-helix repeat-containing protein [Nanoarchaeota archaeon]
MRNGLILLVVSFLILGFFLFASASPETLPQNMPALRLSHLESCSELNISGAYYALKRDILFNSGTVCINITAPRVTLDCRDRTILGSTEGIGIYSNQNDTTLRNCTVSFEGTSLSRGIVISNAARPRVSNVRVFDCGKEGIHLHAVHSAVILNPRVEECQIGLRLTEVLSSRFSGGLMIHNRMKGVVIQGNSSFNRFERLVADSNIDDGFFIGNEGYGFGKPAPSYNFFVDVTTRNNGDKGITFPSSGTHNSFVNFTSFHNGASVRLFGVKNTLFIDSAFVAPITNQILSADSGNSNLTLVRTRFVDTPTNFNDLALVLASSNNHVFVDTPIGPYTLDKLSTFTLSRTNLGSVYFYNGVKGTGLNLSEEIVILHNFVSINASRNSFFDTPSLVTFYNLSLGTSPLFITRNGVFCSGCFNRTALDQENVVIEVPGEGAYSIASL